VLTKSTPACVPGAGFRQQRGDRGVGAIVGHEQPEARVLGAGQQTTEADLVDHRLVGASHDLPADDGSPT
jgi:hypothetical protein